MESLLPGVKVTLALKNLICENLRLARAQFARRECIPRGRGFSQVEGGQKRNAREKRGEKRRRDGGRDASTGNTPVESR